MKFNPPDKNGQISSKHFVKLKDKESITGVFRGDPHDFRQHWLGAKSSVCIGEGCEECAKKNKSTYRFRINLITKDEENKYVAKIFDQGWTVYEMLRGIHEGDYPLDKTIVKITRAGTGQQTNYMILPIPNGSVTPVLEKQFESVKLHDLVNLAEPEEADKPADLNDSDIPF